jgi:hypothetical protein
MQGKNRLWCGSSDRNSAVEVQIADVGFCAILYTSKHRGGSRALNHIHRAGRRCGQEAAGELAKDTGRSRCFLAAEAINDYLDVNEWQVAGIKRAIASLDRGGQ